MYALFLCVASVISLTFIIIGTLAYIHSKSNHYNFNLLSLFIFMIHSLDSIADLCFIINLWINDHTDYINLILFLLFLYFLSMPLILSLFEITKLISKFNETNKSRYFYSQCNIIKIYCICLFIGNIYPSFALFSSHLFDLKSFKLSLRDKDKMLIEKKYFIHTIFIESMPQICISLIYSIYNKVLIYDDFVLFPLIFSIGSIISASFILSSHNILVMNNNNYLNEYDKLIDIEDKDKEEHLKIDNNYHLLIE